jgi:hypothetical protein
MRGSYGGAAFRCPRPLHPVNSSAAGGKAVETFMPFVRRAAGRRNLAGTPFVPTPSPGHGKRRGHRQGGIAEQPACGLDRTSRAAWPHGKGTGLSIQLEALPLNFDGRIVLTERKVEEAEAKAE